MLRNSGLLRRAVLNRLAVVLAGVWIVGMTGGVRSKDVPLCGEILIADAA